MTNPEDIKNLVNDITDFVNSYSSDEKQFIAQMSTEHRTLQQSFTRLVLKWIEHCAKPSYSFDDRNHATHMISRELITRYVAHNQGNKPSDYLPFI